MLKDEEIEEPKKRWIGLRERGKRVDCKLTVNILIFLLIFVDG